MRSQHWALSTSLWHTRSVQRRGRRRNCLFLKLNNWIFLQPCSHCCSLHSNSKQQLVSADSGKRCCRPGWDFITKNKIQHFKEQILSTHSSLDIHVKRQIWGIFLLCFQADLSQPVRPPGQEIAVKQATPHPGWFWLKPPLIQVRVVDFD